MKFGFGHDERYYRVECWCVVLNLKEEGYCVTIKLPMLLSSAMIGHDYLNYKGMQIMEIIKFICCLFLLTASLYAIVLVFAPKFKTQYNLRSYNAKEHIIQFLKFFVLVSLAPVLNIVVALVPANYFNATFAIGAMVCILIGHRMCR